MDLLDNLALGFATALMPVNLFYCFIGVLLGTLIGVLPGIGPTATIAMLLPITFALSPATSLIMLAGIYYGAQYGGSTTAILINLPGESSSAVTAIDGYQMARQGRAGPGACHRGARLVLRRHRGDGAPGALCAAADRAWRCNSAPAEYFSLMVLGLVSVGRARPRLDPQGAGHDRARPAARASSAPTSTPARRASPWTCRELADGLNFVAVAVGVFGIAEILRNLENETRRDRGRSSKVTGLMPTPRGSAGASSRRSCAAPLSARCSASCRAAARSSPPSPPIRSRSGSRERRSDSARAPSKASRRRNRPTMPARRPPSFRCSRSASRPIRSWR